MRNILLTIEYDGSNFHGWQRQKEARTVQGELETALARVCQTPVSLNGASRTDAGVHAYGQAASLEGEFGIPTERIPVAVNNLLRDIRVVTAEDKPPGFHARFDTAGKTYLYRIRACAEPDIFLQNYRYQLAMPLDIVAMREAADRLTGEHDFASFHTKSDQEPESTVRTIYDIAIDERPAADEDTSANEITVTVTGNAFLYNMVRIIVGTLVEVGSLARTPGDMDKILAAKDRAAAGHTAPAAGLWLARVYYDATKMIQCRRYD